jgi:hypothetical protein
MIQKLRNALRRNRGETDDPMDGMPVRTRPGEPIDVTPPRTTAEGAGRNGGGGDGAPPRPVVPDTLVPGGLLGPGGPAGIPTIPAVTMPAIRWTEPIPAGLRIIWRMRSDGGRLRRAGRAGAEAEHHGDPLREAGIAHLLGGLRSTMRQVLRSDPELLGADHFRRSWDLELERRQGDLALAIEPLQAIIAAAEGIDTQTTASDEQLLWSAARNAETEFRDLEERVREAELHEAEAAQYADIAGRRALERLDLVARAGIDRLDLYRTSFNRERTNRPGVDSLPDDLAEELIRETVQPIFEAEAMPDAA